MSRPRPPLHDPYGLLRQPPPETPTSLYSASSNALASTTSLPLPTSTGSPNRRNRQRVISPSRTQHGEEYDDQPYLTNVVRHHGQVTLVPPVNQGRARKVRRRRNPEAATSTVSLADTLAGPSSSGGPSRVSARPRSRSPRRPRQGSEARAVSSRDVRASPYPDYPPPSFEEVVALDRNNASSSTTSPTGQPARENDVPSPMFLVSAPPSLSDPAHNPITTATPWERDRLMGLSLEERVRREYERNLKQSSESDSTLVADNSTSLPQPSSPAPVSSSPTATSATASDFLTPQNLSPSPSAVQLPLSATNSPKPNEPPRSPSLPPVPSKSPDLTARPTRTNGPVLNHDAGPVVRNPPMEPQVPRPVELDRPVISGSNQVVRSESLSSEQASPQGTPPNSEVPLTSLLFTTRLRLDSSPERSPIRESRREPSPVRESRPTVEAGVSRAVKVEPIENIPQRSPFTRVPPVHQTAPVQKSAAGSSGRTSPIRTSSPSRFPVAPQPPSPKPLSPTRPGVNATPNAPARETPEPPQLSSSTTVARRPPPPPPPRPRQRQVGLDVAARISAYEALLENAPKIPPPIPPRPRPRSQTTRDDTPVAQPVRTTPEVGSVGATTSNPPAAQQTTAAPGVESLNVPEGVHTVTQPSAVTRPPRLPPRPISVHTTTHLTRSPSRPASVVLQDVASPVSTPQSDRLASRPLPVPRPERPASMSMSVRGQSSTPPQINSGSIVADVSRVPGDVHTATRIPADTRPRSLSRPVSVMRQATPPLAPISPQLQSNELEFGPLPAPVPLRLERPASTNIQAQALVPARIGPDGKLEIIPDAGVIWLDKPNVGTPERQTGPLGSRTPSERAPLPSVPPESVAGPSNRESEINPFEDSFLGQSATAPTMLRQSSATSSVYQPPSPPQNHPPVPVPGPPAGPSAATDSDTAVSPPAHLADDFEYTDLDLLISRLEENEASRQGANYEQLLTVGEVLGPAHPPPPRPDFDLNAGLIEIQRRRVMKDGRVKLKLSLMGVGVDKCGICLTQFKNNESAVLLPCLHSFHTNCIRSWFIRQDAPACPHCRAPVTQ
ncbi:hypothetical protein OPQ81_009446 [Rhizoctonia solani]|nr:hypothetical protein OPQ81_009446 [Rhizoctonia solani]